MAGNAGSEADGMSVVSGNIIAATGYRWMFIIEGLPAIAALTVVFTGYRGGLRPGGRDCGRGPLPGLRGRGGGRLRGRV